MRAEYVLQKDILVVFLQFYDYVRVPSDKWQEFLKLEGFVLVVFIGIFTLSS